MKKYNILLILILFQLVSLGQIKDSLVVYNSKLKAFVEEVQLQKIDGDIAKIPQMGISLRKYTEYSINNDINSIDQYAFYMILRLFEEYLIVNKWDYEICFMDTSLVKVVLKRMQIEECIFLRTGDVYKWVKEHLYEFDDYPLIARKVDEIEDIIQEEKEKLKKQ